MSKLKTRSKSDYFFDIPDMSSMFGAMFKKRSFNLHNAQINKSDKNGRYYGTDYVLEIKDRKTSLTSKVSSGKRPKLELLFLQENDITSKLESGKINYIQYPVLLSATDVARKASSDGSGIDIDKFLQNFARQYDDGMLIKDLQEGKAQDAKEEKLKSLLLVSADAEGGKRSKKNNLLRNTKKNIKIKKRSLRRQNYLQKCKSKKM